MQSLIIADTNERFYGASRVFEGDALGRGPWTQFAPFEGFAIKTSRTPVYQVRFLTADEFDQVRRNLIVDCGASGDMFRSGARYYYRRALSWLRPGVRYEIGCRIVCKQGLDLLRKNLAHQASRYYGGASFRSISGVWSEDGESTSLIYSGDVEEGDGFEFLLSVLPYQLDAAFDMVRAVVGYHTEAHQCDAQWVHTQIHTHHARHFKAGLNA